MKSPPLEAVLRALADGTRLRMLALLASGEICVCHIHGALGIPQPAASRHLAYLRKSGLVESRRDGLWVHYHLAMPAAPEVAAIVRAAIAALNPTKRLEHDRRRLSGLTTTPVQVLEETAACCLNGDDPGCASCGDRISARTSSARP